MSNYSYTRVLHLVRVKGVSAAPLVARHFPLSRVRATCRVFRGQRSKIVGMTIAVRAKV